MALNYENTLRQVNGHWVCFVNMVVALLIIMTAALRNNDLLILHFVDDTVGFVNSPTPISLPVTFQWFRFADTRKRATVYVF